MAKLIIRNLDEDVVRRLRIRAAEHGRSAEAEHREILRSTLIGAESDRAEQRRRIADRLAEFRRRTSGRGSPSAAQLLAEARAANDPEPWRERTSTMPRGPLPPRLRPCHIVGALEMYEARKER
jgi:antitoxin FitA